jgi:transcriptional regulator with XRE-family HTH domain
MNFGTKLKLVRKLNNLSQSQMADLLFTTQGNYSQYENNNRIPSLDFIKD